MDGVLGETIMKQELISYAVKAEWFFDKKSYSIKAKTEFGDRTVRYTRGYKQSMIDALVEYHNENLLLGITEYFSSYEIHQPDGPDTIEIIAHTFE